MAGELCIRACARHRRGPHRNLGQSSAPEPSLNGYIEARKRARTTGEGEQQVCPRGYFGVQVVSRLRCSGYMCVFEVKEFFFVDNVRSGCQKTAGIYFVMGQELSDTIHILSSLKHSALGNATKTTDPHPSTSTLAFDFIIPFPLHSTNRAAAAASAPFIAVSPIDRALYSTVRRGKTLNGEKLARVYTACEIPRAYVSLVRLACPSNGLECVLRSEWGADLPLWKFVLMGEKFAASVGSLSLSGRKFQDQCTIFIHSAGLSVALENNRSNPSQPNTITLTMRINYALT